MGAEREIDRVITEVELAFHDLEKAFTILNHWANNYMFSENPDPRAAVACGSMTDRPTVHERQSVKWFIDRSYAVDVN